MLALTPKAPPAAVASLVAIVVAAVLFSIGFWLARRGRLEEHRWVQSAGVILSSAVALTWMVRSLTRNVLPEIPARLSQGPYLVAAVHALIGIAGVAFGVYVALVGNKLMPAALSFTTYRPFMRAAYGLYMLATVAGVVLFIVAYVHL